MCTGPWREVSFEKDVWPEQSLAPSKVRTAPAPAPDYVPSVGEKVEVRGTRVLFVRCVGSTVAQAGHVRSAPPAHVD